jgi:hypothetical protein
MLVPLSWLKEYVEINLPLADLVERMTLAGLAVDAIHQVGDWWDPEFIRVGQVIQVAPHPDADRLVLVDVDFGGAAPQRVVTGRAESLPVSRCDAAAHPQGRLCPRRRGAGGRLQRRTPAAQEEAQAIQDPRRGVGRHGLLRARTGPERGARRHHRPARRRARRRPPARLPGRPGAGTRPDARHGALSQRHRRGARGGGAHRRRAAPAARRVPRHGRRRGRRLRGGAHRRAGTVQPLHRHHDPECRHRPVPALAARPADDGGDAPDQQRGGHHQLRDAGVRPAPPRLRLRHPGGAGAPRRRRHAHCHRASRRRGREVRHPRRRRTHPGRLDADDSPTAPARWPSPA